MKINALIIYFFSQSIFFGTLALFSIEYNEGGSLYSIYRLALATFVFVVILRLIPKNRSIRLTFNRFYVLSFTLIILSAAVVSYLYYDQSPIISQLIIYIMGLSIPGILIALTIRNREVDELYNKMKYLNIYLTFCFLTALVIGGSSNFSAAGGGNHLMIGYTMALLFPYNFQKMFFSAKLRSKIFYFSLLFINVYFVLLTGSRGALVSMLCIFIFQYYIYVLKRRRFFLFTIPVGLIIYLIYKYVEKNPYVLDNFSRILLIFNSDISVVTSNRDFFYSVAYESFLDSPIIGNGIGSFGVKTNNYAFPHNLFLEVAHDFGILGLTVFALILIVMSIKLFILFKSDNLSLHLVGFFFITLFISLMFSGTYLTNFQFIMSSILIFTLVPIKVFKKSRQYSSHTFNEKKKIIRHLNERCLFYA